MKKITIPIVVALLCLNFGAAAQSIKKIKPLSIGDTVPDISLGTIINYPKSTAKLSDFKGKLLILDFWATWCSACLQYIPRIEQIQHKLRDSVEFIGITDQNTSVVHNFFSKNKDINNRPYSFPTVMEDTAFHTLFPHRGIPHYVWIDPSGKVAAITGGDQVTEINIKKMLYRQASTLKVKKDISREHPLFLSEDILRDSVKFYSLLVKGYYSGLPSGTKFRKSGNVIYGRAITNSSLIYIYDAVGFKLFEKRGERYNKKRLVLNVRDSTKLLMSKTRDGFWSNDETYNYDLIVPKKLADSLYEYMLQDLNKGTDYRGHLEKRQVTSYILSINDGGAKIKTKGGEQVNTLFREKSSLLQNYPISDLVAELNELKEITYPVVDETHYSEPIDIQIRGALSFANIQKQLRRYGLDLKVGTKALNMFVISDK